MKCESKVVWKEKKIGKSAKLHRYIHQSFNATHPNPPAEAVVCGGRIIASIDTGSYGYGCSCCSGSVIEVEFKCDACRQTVHPGLPIDRYSLEDYLTKIIAKL
jgi:hypothetical protein